MSGTTMLMQALTIACDENEDRGIVRFFFTAAALTAGLIQSGLLSLFLVTVSPAFLDRLPFPGLWREAVFLCRLVLAGRAVAGLGLSITSHPDDIAIGRIGSAPVPLPRRYSGSSALPVFPSTSAASVPMTRSTGRSGPS